MLRSNLMIFISNVALKYGIVTYVSDLSQNLVGMNEKSWAVWFWFWFWEWTPSIGRKVGIPRGILPHVQTGLTNWKSR